MDTQSRRTFLGSATGGTLLAASLSGAMGAAEPPGMTPPAPTEAGVAAGGPALDLRDIPNFTGHEHWGSMPNIGNVPEGFRADVEPGATPTRPTSLWDLVLDPYLGGWVGAAGCSWFDLARAAGYSDFLPWWEASPGATLDALRPHLQRQAATGAFQCIRRGILLLHGIDIGGFDLDAWQRADAALATAYADIMTWYARAKAAARFSDVVRPVHPEFFYRDNTSGAARREREIMRPILRIDPLLHFWKDDEPRRDGLGKEVGVAPADEQSWRDFLDALFERAAARGNAGIKQLQAYSRHLDFGERAPRNVKFRGKLSDDEVIEFQNWVVHECCARAHARKWPHQVHVGTHNLTQSNPLPLESIAHRYPNMTVVLLHGWPFVEECGWLMKHKANICMDPCWQPILNPDFFRQSLRVWLGYAPWHKILCGHDATSVEMAAGSSLFVREILGETLAAHGAALNLDNALLVEMARAMLHDNAERIYGATPQA